MNYDARIKEFEMAWKAGQRPNIVDFVAGATVTEVYLARLIQIDCQYRTKAGETPDIESYKQWFPQLFADTFDIAPMLAGISGGGEQNDSLLTFAGPIVAADPADWNQSPDLPKVISRYRILKLLGEGTFGRVYLGLDEQLVRKVAIKVPKGETFRAETYLAEARMVAKLDHPHIVSIHDVGSTADFPFFIVSKFIDGGDLSTRIKKSRLKLTESVELVAKVADALHHAHKHGLVHRDVKPANILFDRQGEPFLVDFGLALRDEDVGQGAEYCGTPAYMSPEQARGEGHRVDGRSDIFSLGIVLYELLSGHRPFKGKDQASLRRQITQDEARPLRQYDESIPIELDRICSKALSKRASDRYQTGYDLAEDLRLFLKDSKSPHLIVPAVVGTDPLLRDTSHIRLTPSVGAISDSIPARIVPKGLRSFDAQDADFFLALLPGPRDRNNLPESVRFWKTRVEETNGGNTFSVGLIYGPSGCGKSSLVKAGLLPRLTEDVCPIYVEATGSETESRLLNGLRKRFSDLSDSPGLKESIAALRRGQTQTRDKKVLIVLDQFEQWLHAKKDETNTELVQALRQCDGTRVQCIILVRDDFWMAVTRFFREMDFPLDGGNSAAVDLFDLDHARKVLASFGKSFERLPEKSSNFSSEQNAFLEQAVHGLSQEGKVISVRLSLFAEMMKGKPWTTESLNDVGGTDGVGVTFLEETFSSKTATPRLRFHQKGARAVLQSLLPDAGTDIKGHMRSIEELRDVSGYANRPDDFDELIRILDGEFRLMTPTDPEGKEDASEATFQKFSRFYQLTHDYLVPSLREWLTRKQKETRHGRAQLALEDRTAIWTSRKENRQLPSFWQWLQILRHTNSKSWTAEQRTMMKRARVVYATNIATSTVLASMLFLGGFSIWRGFELRQKSKDADGLVRTLVNADISKVPSLISEMSGYRLWTDDQLRDEFKNADENSAKKLHASLALLPIDPQHVDYLFKRLLEAKPQEVQIICDQLKGHKESLQHNLWSVVESPDKGKEAQRLRAASALAMYDPANTKWKSTYQAVADDLVAVTSVFVTNWMECLRPVKAQLVPRLIEIYRSANRPATERSQATDILVDYASDQPDVLANLVMDGDEKQFSKVFPELNESSDAGIQHFKAEIDLEPFPSDLPFSDLSRELRAKRQANAAVALLLLNQPEAVWKLLALHPLDEAPNSFDPRVRSYLIHRLAAYRVDSSIITQRFVDETDITIKRALLLSLGEFADDMTEADQNQLVPILQELYVKEADPGLHSGLEWLLKSWNHEPWLKQFNHDWSQEESWKQRLSELEKALRDPKHSDSPRWYLNSQGQTMIVIPGPVEFFMGTAGKSSGEDRQHRRRIGRTFALSSTTVTLEQYRRYDSEHTKKLEPAWVRHEQLPVTSMSWFMAAKYCNWLSEKEQLDPCYEINGDKISLKDNYLNLSGYRLPTEAEMEYATRSKTMTSRFFGESDELLPKYAWYQENSKQGGLDVTIQPVGLLKPNDFGFFDIQGNVWCWCQERQIDYPEGTEIHEDREDTILAVAGDVRRVLRGGTFFHPSSSVQSSYRYRNVASLRNNNVGIRIARTFFPGPDRTSVSDLP